MKNIRCEKYQEKSIEQKLDEEVSAFYALAELQVDRFKKVWEAVSSLESRIKELEGK